MIKIDHDIIEMSDEQVKAARMLASLMLTDPTLGPKLKARLEKRIEMFETEIWTRAQVAQLKA